MKKEIKNFYDSILEDEGLERALEISLGLEKIVKINDENINSFITYQEEKIEKLEIMCEKILQSYDNTLWQFLISSVFLIVVNLLLIYLIFK